MSRGKYKWERRRALLCFACTLPFLTFLNCGVPVSEPVTVDWALVATTGVEIHAIAGENNGRVWLVGESPPNSSESQGRILRWDGSSLEEVYKVEEKGSELYGVDFAGGVGWATGYLFDGEVYNPILLRYENGGWSRVRSFPPGVDGLSRVVALDPDSFWVTAGDVIYKYDAGAWSAPYPVAGVSDVAASPSGVVFAWSAAGSVWIFDGRNWVKESVALPKGFSMFGITDAAATDGGIYFTCKVYLGKFDYGAVLFRDLAPAGSGTYELRFFAPAGPFFYYLNCVAFRSYNRGIALGPQTHIICDNGEFFEGLLHFEFGTPEDVFWANEGKYWMISRHEGGAYGLYFLNG